MKRLLRLFVSLGLFCIVTLRAADEKLVAALRAADDERIAATIAADARRLDAIYSDALHYAHSNGRIDTKTSLLAALTTRTTIYETFDYAQRDFTPIAPGVALMTGRARMQASNQGKKVALDLSFLAVWREERGTWRFVAWQSAR